MKYSQCSLGRTFIIRLENGEIVHEEIEKFARMMSIRAAAIIIVGGADKGTKLIVGPQNGEALPVKPLVQTLENVHEITGTGTLFPDENGDPSLHMHIACGRQRSTTTGCVREGVKVWHVMEVILIELSQTAAIRNVDPKTGFHLLEP